MVAHTVELVFYGKHILDSNILIVDNEYDWLCCMRINVGNDREYYLVNVYLPYECTDNRDEFNDRLAKLNVFINNISSTCVTVVGDFNANLDIWRSPVEFL